MKARIQMLLDRFPRKQISNLTLITAVTFFLWMQATSNSARFYLRVAPLGDPFTYCIGYFQLLDRAQAGLIEMFTELLDVLLGRVNWYWLQDLLVILFSPLLSKEISSLIIINFFLYFLWSLLSFKMISEYLESRTLQLLVSLAPWFLPLNYGFAEYSAPGTMGLDASFTPALGLSLTACLFWISKYEKAERAIVASIATLMAIFGRGNSIFVVLLVLAIPLTLIFKRLVQSKRKAFFPFTLFFLLTSVGTFLYYWRNWGPITQYYTAHLNFVTRHELNFNDVVPYLKNIPGFMFWRHEASLITMTLTFLIHLLMILSILISLQALRKRGNDFGLVLIFIGNFIYWMTYITNIVLFTDPLMNIYNALLIWRPMTLGMISVFSGLLILFKNRFPRILFGRFLILSIIFAFSIFFTNKQTPWEWSVNRPSPGAFASQLDLLSKYESVGLMYYGSINPQILDFYSVQKKGSLFSRYMGKNYNSLWSQWDYSPEAEGRIRDEILEQFKESSAVVIPEYLDQYSLGQPYAVNQNRDLFVDLYREGLLPRMKIVGYLEENANSRLVILVRTSEEHEAKQNWVPIIRG